jgi:hypothetical protein
MRTSKLILGIAGVAAVGFAGWAIYEAVTASPAALSPVDAVRNYFAVVKKWADHPPTSAAEATQAKNEVASAKAAAVDAIVKSGATPGQYGIYA